MKLLHSIVETVRWRRTRSRVFRTASLLHQNLGDGSVTWASGKSLDAWQRFERQQALFYEDVAREAYRQIWRRKVLEAIGESQMNTAPGAWRRQ